MRLPEAEMHTVNIPELPGGNKESTGMAYSEKRLYFVQRQLFREEVGVNSWKNKNQGIERNQAPHMIALE